MSSVNPAALNTQGVVFPLSPGVLFLFASAFSLAPFGSVLSCVSGKERYAVLPPPACREQGSWGSREKGIVPRNSKLVHWSQEE